MASARSVAATPSGAPAAARDPGLPTSARPPARDMHPPFTAGVRLRRRPGLIGLGVALVALGSLAAAYLVTSLAGTTGAVVATRDVAAGQVVAAEDVRVIDIGGGAAGASYVPASSLPDVIGRRTTVPLLSGQIVPPQALSAARLVPTGENGAEALVGLPVTSAQLPATTLQAGDSILVVDTPAPQADPPERTPDALPAIVVTTGTDEISGVTVVTVVADTDTAKALAARAATGRFAIVVVAAVSPQPVG